MATSGVPQTDALEVAGALLTSMSLLRRRMRTEPIEGDITVPERAALAWLDIGGPATPSALARLEQISPQSMGTTLAGLEARGLIVRRPDPVDGRLAVMSVTEEGLAVLRNKRSARAERLARALTAECSRAEVARLKAAVPVIERLAQHL